MIRCASVKCCTELSDDTLESESFESLVSLLSLLGALPCFFRRFFLLFLAFSPAVSELLLLSAELCLRFFDF
jgi:hypothetical protein